MPKCSTNFQDLIELLERQLAPAGATITASKLLKDARSGQDREVDIVIETKSGIHPVTIGIEVVEHKRPTSAPWIEGMAKRHGDLAIDKSIAVSRSGFYRPAIKKAAAYKIDTLTLQEASELDWKARIDQIPSIKTVSFLMPYLTGGTVVFADESSIAQYKEIDPKTIELYNRSGESRGSLQSVLERFIADEGFIDKVKQRAFTDAATLVEGELHLQKGSYILGPNNQRHGVHSLKFKARCKNKEADTELLKGRYRDTAVVMASGDSFGHAVQMVFTEGKEGEDAVVSVRIKKRRTK